MYKALVVDDRGISFRLRQGLVDSHYQVFSYFHPEEALQELRSRTKPELIISDVRHHPDMSGIKFVGIARDILGPHSRIYLWTGYYSFNGTPSPKMPVDARIHNLFATGVIDGYAPKYSPYADMAMLELITTNDFEAFAEKYGLVYPSGIDTRALSVLAEQEAIGPFQRRS